MLNMRQKQAVTKTVKLRYKRARKKDKSVILDEFVSTTGYNRSYARRILGSRERNGTILAKRKLKKQHRKRKYDLEVFIPLRKIWVVADGICGKRLKPFIPELVAVLERNKEIKLNKKVKKKLYSVSSATIDRILKVTRNGYKLKGKATTKPGTLLRSTIKIRTFSDWDESRPGFFEVDLVAFCGDTVKGDYVNGLNMTDVATGWVGLEATLGKAQSRVHPAIDGIRKRLPFEMLGIDSDNGVEFINWILKRYCEEYRITFTRIRPYRKNDNCFVEQKNYTVLRRFLGYARYDTEKQLELVCDILKLVEVYVNFFQPVMKLKERRRVGSKVKKIYDTAKTPYQRLLESSALTEEAKEKLREFYGRLNPVEIKRGINKLTEKLNRTLRYINLDATNT